MSLDGGENWIRLHDEMPDHPKIDGLSDRGFRLLVTTWCWCNRNLTDGRVPVKVWNKRGTPASRRELLAADLIEQLEDGSVQVHDYLYWQRSAMEIAEAMEKKKRAGQKGNHERWHVKERKFDPKCELCQEALNDSHEASQVGSHLRSQMGSQNGRTRIAEREVEKEEITPKDPSGAAEKVTPDRARDDELPQPSLPELAPGPAITGPNAKDAYRLVDRAIGREHPHSIRTALAIEAGSLLMAGTESDLITAALRLWLDKPHLGPRVLPSLVSEAIRTRDRPMPIGTTDKRTAAIQALKAHFTADTDSRALPGGSA